MAVRKVLITGAAGYIASYVMPGLRGRYDLTLLDVRDVDREGRRVEGVVTADLTDPDRSGYRRHFEGMDAVIHLGHKSRRREPLDDFHDEVDNVRMVYNVLRCAYDASVPRVAVASSNHAADWYEHALIHERKMEVLDPYAHPLSDNFYGWAKASYEHLGFLFACGFPIFQDASGREIHVSPKPGPRRLEVVNVRIGAPREIDASNFGGDPAGYKRDLGAYVSGRDLAQLFRRAIEDAGHRERAWHPVAGSLWDQWQHPRLLVAVERQGRARLRAGGRFGGQVRGRHRGFPRQRGRFGKAGSLMDAIGEALATALRRISAVVGEQAGRGLGREVVGLVPGRPESEDVEIGDR